MEEDDTPKGPSPKNPRLPIRCKLQLQQALINALPASQPWHGAICWMEDAPNYGSLSALLDLAASVVKQVPLVSRR